MKIIIKRVYDKPSRNDGFRILVDRLWPRGVSKNVAKIDLWVKEVAPSVKLRSWFHEDRIKRFKEFEERYQKELRVTKAIRMFKKIARGNPRITFVTSVKDFEYSHIPTLLRKLGE